MALTVNIYLLSIALCQIQIGSIRVLVIMVQSHYTKR